MKHATVAEVMSRDVYKIAEETAVLDLCRFFVDQDIPMVAVVDADNRVLGAVLQKNLLDALAVQTGEDESEIFQDKSIFDFFMPDSILIQETEPVAEAAKRLVESRIEHLIVINADRRLKGLLSIWDLIRWLAQEDRPRLALFRDETPSIRTL